MRIHSSLCVKSAACALVIVLFASGCGEDRSAERVRTVRLSGQPDSARVMALSMLGDNANRMTLWLEFVRSSLDEVRLRPNEQSHANDLDILLQGCLVCSAVYQNAKHDPPREWHDTGRLLSAELARQISDLMTKMTVQFQSANMIKQMLFPTGPDTLIPHGPDIRAQQTLAGYRAEARSLLFWPVVLRRLMESLPEVNPGTTSLLAGQMDEAIPTWSRSLDLDPALITTVQQRARNAVDRAMNKAEQDLHDLGYFLPQTITDNGVSL